MLLAEELLLLAYDGESGRQRGFMNLEYLLAGAVLVDLARHGCVDITEKGTKKRSTRLRVHADAAPTGDAVLDTAHRKAVKYDGRVPRDAVAGLHRKLARTVRAALTERGVLREEKRAVAGIIPVRRWPAEEPHHEHAIRQRLHEVLVTGADPDERTAALIALLSAGGMISRVVDKQHRKAAKRRAGEIAEGDWASEAVRAALAAITTAVAAGAAGGAAAGG
ncbi:GPP34 family phosphoprotein [Haloechinothrix sp. YIM 98757]|uniref:GPP34 family phosphoprotein n=1 Tax=Haloechinothrix aidingensis TaxID=2752311 RepID=A0A838A168_9PSEU|nr:GPP34 family phosphoprotein [Haloechinothrix aidingensis]